jgi:hypothetical protein
MCLHYDLVGEKERKAIVHSEKEGRGMMEDWREVELFGRKGYYFRAMIRKEIHSPCREKATAFHRWNYCYWDWRAVQEWMLPRFYGRSGKILPVLLLR